MANCPKCGKTKLNRNADRIYWCRRCGGRKRPVILEFAPVPDELKQHHQPEAHHV